MSTLKYLSKGCYRFDSSVLRKKDLQKDGISETMIKQLSFLKKANIAIELIVSQTQVYDDIYKTKY